MSDAVEDELQTVTAVVDANAILIAEAIQLSSVEGHDAAEVEKLHAQMTVYMTKLAKWADDPNSGHEPPLREYTIKKQCKKRRVDT